MNSPSPQRSAQKSGSQFDGGFALVVVLLMLVLMLGITLAYFSRASLHRQIGVSSTSSARANLLSRSAVEYVLSDLLTEIEAGSAVDSLGAKVTVREPIQITGSNGVRYAPSIAPQRVADDGVANIIKKSKGSTPFFKRDPQDAYRATPAASDRASSISTETLSANGRRISKERWNKPRLMTVAEAASFTHPDWIYLDRKGNHPKTFDAPSLQGLRNQAASNADYVIGRFAYVIYDQGGLIDINVAGNALDEEDNSRRGRMHQVSLPGVGAVTLPKFDDFVTWRSPLSKDKGGDAAGSLGDPRRTFIDVATGEQTLVNRQDLISYALHSGTNGPIPPATLPYLTTFTRDLNAPSFAPDFTGTTPPPFPIPAGLDATYELNPALLSVRFGTDVTLNRPDGAISVKAGTPVLPRRFPLSKLKLLSQASPNAAEILYYFGLEKQSDGSWKYVNDVNGRIARLKEVAEAGREPNFFEILQATIYSGSLGRHAGAPTSADRDNTMTFSYLKDSLMNRQVMQIGANIIDQWDGDDMPTRILYPSGIPSDPIVLYGVENLPYLHQISLIPIRPKYNRDQFQFWGVVTVWNPHQNAVSLPADVQEFRIKATSGSSNTLLAYALPYPSTDNYPDLFNECSYVVNQSFTELNQNKELTFPAAPYSEPTAIRGLEPEAATDVPGLLLSDYDLNISSRITTPMQARANPAIPKKSERPASLQRVLNGLFALEHPYTALNGSGLPATYSDSGGTTGGGNRVYPAGTKFSGVNTTYWSVDPSLPPDGEATTEPVTIYAKYGVKAHNFATFRPSATNPLSLELQANFGGNWVTYQRIEGWWAQAPTATDGKESISDALRNTHHSESPNPLQNYFYEWNTESSSRNTLLKIDPRSERFGLSDIASDHYKSSTPIGMPLRSSTNAWTGRWLEADKLSKNWLYVKGNRTVGMDAANALVSGFSHHGTGRVMPFGLITNDPNLLNGDRPMRYEDPDGRVRPADGYWGAHPTLPVTALPAPRSIPASGTYRDRPLILNRPFRSVGELGYVFRDLPFKTMDFASERSADLGLLDVFSLDESMDETPLVAGKVNLNTRNKEVLAAILRGSAKQDGGANSTVAHSVMADSEAAAIAAKIVAESTSRPFSYKGDVIKRLLGLIGSNPSNPLTDLRKTEREAAVRTLAEMGTTNTWNLMIDVISQSGRFTASSKTGSDFQVQAERRYWVHVAIDRRTGKIVEMRKELVNE